MPETTQAPASPLIRKLEEMLRRYSELEASLNDPAVLASPQKMIAASKEKGALESVVGQYREYQKAGAAVDELKEMSANKADAELAELAASELPEAEGKAAALLESLKDEFVAAEDKAVDSFFLEIRAGTGGEEAALFAGDLYRMYQRFAENEGWRVETMEMSAADAGGIKEVIANVHGQGVFAKLKFESGVHRVQRVPATEASGRIHTSAATVAVLPEAEDVDVQIEDKDLRIDVFRSSGPGGQSVNTTDSAVRITHIPSGIVVSQQDEKSQHKNKAKAMKVLRARLFELERERQASERAGARKSMVGSGDRSERIRTYNFPQGRVTDHRIGLTLHRLPEILEGELSELIDALIAEDQAARLANLNEGG
jgi:peptide chain release factor 1